MNIVNLMNLMNLMHRKSPCIAAAIALLAPLAGAFPQTAPPSAACDPELLRAEGPHAIFVRMRDQLFPTGQAFETFIAEHATTKRSSLRTRTIADLQARAERSWNEVRDAVEKLAAAGELRDVQRYWIANGIACTASRSAVEKLVALAPVAFVHRQTQPGQKLHERGTRAPRWIEQRREDLAQALAQRKASEPDAFDPRGLEVPWNLRRIRADEAWKSGARGEGVVIALLDTGVLAMPPLTRALWQNPAEEPNGKDDDGNGYTDDLFGWDFQGETPYVVGDGPSSHGTMCGGILAGRAHGEPRTITGIAPLARLMVLRGMGDLRAYEYAAREGADVLSMSYMWIDVELGSFRGVFRTAHEHLAACGLVAVGGAGNFGRSSPAGRQIALPKDIPIVIAAAGIAENGNAPAFSSRGPCTWDEVPFFLDHPAERPLAKPDVAGCIGGFPVWHRTSGPSGRDVEVVWDAGDGTGLIRGPSGNSFSGPHAGGVAALVLSAQSELTPWRVKALIEATCSDLGEKGRDTTYGAGLLQADRAVLAAREARIE